MKVLHVTYSYLPEEIAGSEIDVLRIMRCLDDIGVESEVAAPGDKNEEYVIEDRKIYKFCTGEKYSNDELYGRGDDTAAKNFLRILDKSNPDLVHLHAYAPAVNAIMASALSSRRQPVAYTFYTPTMVCQRGTLLQRGKEVCDGVMREGLCSACSLEDLGIPTTVADGISKLPESVAASISGNSKIQRTLGFRHLMSKRIGAASEFLDNVDVIFSPCRWGEDVLARNGFGGKVKVSRHGIPKGKVLPRKRSHVVGDRVRVAFFGRVEKIKGLHIIVNAFESLDSNKIGLDIYGIYDNNRYAYDLKKKVGGVEGVEVKDPVSSDSVVQKIREFDLLAIPSIWMEVGPIVALEAKAAGTPIIGSRRGGIQEVVKSGVDGQLVEAGNIQEWRRVLKEVSEEPSRIEEWTNTVREPRRTEAVAEDYYSVYKKLVK